MARTHRFELSMGEDVSNDLEELAIKLNTDWGDVLFRALSLYKEVKKEDGVQVVLVNANKKKVTRIVADL